MIKCKSKTCPVRNLCKRYTLLEPSDAAINYYKSDIPNYQCEEMVPVNNTFKISNKVITGAYFKIKVEDNLVIINGESVSIKYYIYMSDNILSGFKLGKEMKRELDNKIHQLITEYYKETNNE